MFNKIKKQYLALLVLVPVIAITYSVMNNPITLQCDRVNIGSTKLSLKDFTTSYKYISGYDRSNYFQFNPKWFKSSWDKKTNEFLFKSKKVFKYNKEYAGYSLNVPLKILNKLERPRDPINTDFTKQKNLNVSISMDRVAGEVNFEYYDRENRGKPRIKMKFYGCAKISTKDLPKLPKAKF